MNGKAKGENRRKDKYILEMRLNGVEPKIEKIVDRLEENKAYDIEEALILQYGRQGYEKNGILMNICLSNRPPSHKGRKRSKETRERLSNRTVSPETKQKLSNSQKGKNNSMFGRVGPNKGKIFSKSHRKKMSESHKGKKQSPETIRKRQETKKRLGITIARKTIEAAANKRRGTRLPKAWIEKRTSTRKANGSYKRKPESVLKGMITTLSKNGYNTINKHESEIRLMYGVYMAEKRKSKNRP